LSPEALVHGVLVVDKPAGPTSHDVVDRVRAVFRMRRVGHTGTLDPFATGVLPVCLGKATRLAAHLANGDKVYRATVRFGFATTTDDLEGEPIGTPVGVAVQAESISAALPCLTGALMQVPPAFSAKRYGGKRLHELARRGIQIERKPVPVTVHALELQSVEGDQAVIEVRCSAGTYVRALARDLGQALGTGAHLRALRRLAAGAFEDRQAVRWDRLDADGPASVIPLSALLGRWPAARVGAEGRAAVRHGRDLTRQLVISGFPDRVPDSPVRVLDEAGELIALASCRGGFLTAAEAPALPPVLHPDVVLGES
jgi:tRNA pseudouridine55 synthase